jgi:microcystin-dependent protein
VKIGDEWDFTTQLLYCALYRRTKLIIHSKKPDTMEGVLAVVTCFAANFNPRFWAFCNGQLLVINQNTALFSLLGTTYGGNGTTTFALPDLRGRTAISAGQGPGLSNYTLGQSSGAASISLLPTNLPPHIHNGAITLQLPASQNDGIDPTPNSGYPARFTGAYATTANATMQDPAYNATIGNAGGGQPLGIRSPFLAMNYIICLSGIFPSRN